MPPSRTKWLPCLGATKLDRSNRFSRSINPTCAKLFIVRANHTSWQSEIRTTNGLDGVPVFFIDLSWFVKERLLPICKVPAQSRIAVIMLKFPDDTHDSPRAILASTHRRQMQRDCPKCSQLKRDQGRHPKVIYSKMVMEIPIDDPLNQIIYELWMVDFPLSCLSPRELAGSERANVKPHLEEKRTVGLQKLVGGLVAMFYFSIYWE